jgi:membrane protein DedA with SNARE-associated domain
MTDWITTFIEQQGYWAVAALMLAENIFPPIPSELIMPFAGFAASRGTLNPWLVVVAGTAGSVAGALFWYTVGRCLGYERLRRWVSNHGRWLTISIDELDRTQAWFDSHGHLAVLFGRLLPAVRTLISVPAGVTRMPIERFLLWSTIGSTVWTGVLTLAGFALGSRYATAAGAMDWITKGILTAIALWYLWRVVSWRQRQP